jgi:hypothetical protein
MITQLNTEATIAFYGTHVFTRVGHNSLSSVYVLRTVGGGEWSPNWVHSAPRPFTVLLYLPRVIVRMENFVE